MASAPPESAPGSAPEPAAEWPVACEIEPDQPAVAICSSCGAFIGKGSRVVNDHGLAECRRCRGEVPGSRIPFESSGLNPFARFALTARAVLVTPTDFVRRLDPRGKLGPAVLFGAICIIVGQSAAFFWQRVIDPERFHELIQMMAAEWEVTPGQVELMFLTSLPFEALIRLGLCGLLLQLGALLTGTREALRYRDYVRIFGYASAAYLLQIIPLFVGGILALIFVMVICARALRIHHRLSNLQTLIASAPLALGIGLLGLWGGM